MRKAGLFALGLVAACSRSEMHVSVEKAPRTLECLVDADCVVTEDLCLIASCHAGTCVVVGEVRCDDGDPCTNDRCVPATGQCEHEPVTYDLDGDGHRAPLPGFAPGEPGACGDDCDDTSASAYPGAPEICDGVDNDCNGIVDDGMAYMPAEGFEAIEISDADASPAGPDHLAFGFGSYVTAYSGLDRDGKINVFLRTLGQDGSLGEALTVTSVPADASDAQIVFTGDRFGVAWHDRREGDYEVFFNTLDASGNKTGPDLNLSRAFGFSLNPALTWTGREFVVVWQDEAATPGARFSLLGQRISLDATPIGSAVLLGPLMGVEMESPAIATGRKSLGVVATVTEGQERRIVFQSFDFELNPLTASPVNLVPSGRSGVFPTIVWNEAAQNYLVAYYDPTSPPYAIYAAIVDEDGNIVVSTRPVTESPGHARYPALLSLGNRVLLVYSDDRDGNLGYELYTKMLDETLAPVSPELRLTSAIGESVMPKVAFGPQGEVGVLFRDDRHGRQSVFFSKLVCTAGIQP